MIRYNTSNDRICKIIRSWCKEKEYIYSFDEVGKKNTDVYPFIIFAPSYAEKELIERIDLLKNRGVAL